MGRTTRWATVGVLVLTACATTQPAARSAPEATPAGIRAALESWTDAASRGDLAAAVGQFDDQADVLLVGSDKGEVFQGRVAIEGWLRRILAKNRFSWAMDRVEISTAGETAWVFVEGSMKVSDPAGTPRFTAPYRFSGVLVRRGDGWAWRLWHGSMPRAE